MTAQSLLVVLRGHKALKEARLDLILSEAVDSESVERESFRTREEIGDLNCSIRVIEEVLRSTREARKELGDPTLEAEADLATGSGGWLHASTPS